ncbi:MAG TPA: ATP-binding protein [Gemmatimonadaceae bacterium]|nr:ATP-binding protein [Gemmatimonadaceae bacterium]
MRLRSRLLVGALAVIAVQVIVVVLLVQRQLTSSLQRDAVAALAREAKVVAAHWASAPDPDALAKADGRALGHRVTLIGPDGVVVGDADVAREDLATMENHSSRPEVIAARAGDVGLSTRTSPTRGDQELYVAVNAGALGVARVSMSEYSLTSAIDTAHEIVIVAGAVSLLIALVVAWTLAQRIAQPVGELTDVAKGIAAGDLSRRASIAPAGELGELALSLRELSEQLAARDNARHAYETLLEQLTESLNEGIVGVDAARRVARINDTARYLLGVREALPFSVDLLPRDRALRDALNAAFAGRTTEDSEAVIQGHTVNVTARPLESGGAVLALFDLTRVRRLENVRRDFVANVSHELRTPITIVSGFAETLVNDDVDPDQRKQFAQRILVNTQRMQRIVDDLLDLSRIESGSWAPNPEDVDLDVAAAEAVTAARDAAKAKRVAIDADIAPDARVVHADVTAIRQVLGNLVDNAVRHTSAGSVTIFSRATPDAIELGVRDTGSGIASEHLPRIFERFYRVDPGRSRDQGGTGLGLAVVRLLVEAHGGNVRAESMLGTGTTVVAEFPRRV